MHPSEVVRRAPRYVDLYRRGPEYFEGIHDAQGGQYVLSASELDRMGKSQGGGMVGTFRDLEQARTAARKLRTDNKGYQPVLDIDPDDRFADHDLWEAGQVDEFRAQFQARRAAHFEQFVDQPKILNPFQQTWPGQSPEGAFMLSARRLDQKEQSRQPLARFETEEAALACHDAIISSNEKWDPYITISF